MKTFSKILAAVLGLAFSFNATAAGDPWPVYATGGTDVSTTLCYAVISSYSVNGGSPVVTYLSATSDKAGSVVQFYRSSVPLNITTASSTTNLAIATNSMSGFTSNAIVVIQHNNSVGTPETFERRVVYHANSTNVAVSATFDASTAAGDKVWLQTAGGSIPVGNASITPIGDGIYSGVPGRPLLLEVDGTSACQINAVNAVYVK